MPSDALEGIADLVGLEVESEAVTPEEFKVAYAMRVATQVLHLPAQSPNKDRPKAVSPIYLASQALRISHSSAAPSNQSTECH